MDDYDRGEGGGGCDGGGRGEHQWWYAYANRNEMTKNQSKQANVLWLVPS